MYTFEWLLGKTMEATVRSCRMHRIYRIGNLMKCDGTVDIEEETACIKRDYSAKSRSGYQEGYLYTWDAPVLRN